MFTRLSLIVLVCTLVAGFCETAYAQTGACCIGGGCMIDTEANCIGGGGVYAGDNTDCAGSGAGGGADCNANGVIDTCDIANCSFGDPTCDDCNNNGLPDSCDISSGFSQDLDMNGVPDECIFWTGLGDGTNWGNPGNWSPMEVPNNLGPNTFSVVIDTRQTGSNINVNLNIDATIDTLRLLETSPQTADLTFSTGSLTIANAGGIRDDGQITINDTHALLADTSFGINGKGTLSLNGATASLSATIPMAGKRIINDITIDGRGVISADFTNNSVNSVTANDPGGSIIINGGSVINNGSMSGTTGGTLDIDTNITEDPGGTGSVIAQGGDVVIGGDMDDPRTVDGCGPIESLPGSVANFTLIKSSLSGFSHWTIGNDLQPIPGVVEATITVRNLASGVVAGPVQVNGNGRLFVDQSTVAATNAIIIDTGRLDIGGVAPPSQMTLTGPYSFTGTDETLINWGTGSTLRLQGGQIPCPPNSADVSIEAGGSDVGPAPGGFVDNFDFSVIELDTGANVLLVDQFDNGNRNGPIGFAEAIYADTLIMGVGSVLHLNNLNLYVGGVQVLPGPFGGGQVVDTVIPSCIPAVSHTSRWLLLLVMGGVGILAIRRGWMTR
ncbi:MAG: hypothetical protein ACE5EC_01090 [Phycisphaerae bacterium]